MVCVLAKVFCSGKASGYTPSHCEDERSEDVAVHRKKALAYYVKALLTIYCEEGLLFVRGEQGLKATKA